MGVYGKTPFFPYSRPPINPIFENSKRDTRKKNTRFLETVASQKYRSVRAVEAYMTDGDQGPAHAIKKKGRFLGGNF